MAVYCFDLDDTICWPQHDAINSHDKYEMAKPNPAVIERVRLFHSSGHRIIIHTARRMLTHKGDLNKIEQDVGKITRDWLSRHDVPYHELIFGKPYADFYVDDKSVSLEVLESLSP